MYCYSCAQESLAQKTQWHLHIFCPKACHSAFDAVIRGDIFRARAHFLWIFDAAHTRWGKSIISSTTSHTSIHNKSPHRRANNSFEKGRRAPWGSRDPGCDPGLRAPSGAPRAAAGPAAGRHSPKVDNRRRGGRGPKGTPWKHRSEASGALRGATHLVCGHRTLMLGPRGVWVARAATRPAEMDVAASVVHGAGALTPAPLCRKVAGRQQAKTRTPLALHTLGTRSKIEPPASAWLGYWAPFTASSFFLNAFVAKCSGARCYELLNNCWRWQNVCARIEGSWMNGLEIGEL